MSLLSHSQKQQGSNYSMVQWNPATAKRKEWEREREREREREIKSERDVNRISKETKLFWLRL